jgi:hypothetical protein
MNTNNTNNHNVQVVPSITWTHPDYLTISKTDILTFLRKNYDNPSSKIFSTKHYEERYVESDKVKRFFVEQYYYDIDNILLGFRSLLTIVSECLPCPGVLFTNEKTKSVFKCLMDDMSLGFRDDESYLFRKGKSILVKRMVMTLHNSVHPTNEDDFLHSISLMGKCLTSMKNLILTRVHPNNVFDDSLYKMVWSFLHHNVWSDTSVEYPNVRGRVLYDKLNNYKLKKTIQVNTGWYNIQSLTDEDHQVNSLIHDYVSKMESDSTSDTDLCTYLTNLIIHKFFEGEIEETCEKIRINNPRIKIPNPIDLILSVSNHNKFHVPNVI